MFQSCRFGFFNATEKAEAEATRGVGSWRDQETDRHPLQMPVRLQAAQTKHNVVRRYVNVQAHILISILVTTSVDNITHICAMRSFQAPTDCFHCRHFSSPAGIEHSIVDVTFRCFKSRCAQKNSAAGCIKEAAGFTSQVPRDNNGRMRIAANACEPHCKFSGLKFDMV